jgi:hypothetical protein
MRAIVATMQDLMAKTSQDAFRKRKIPGVGLRSIYSALQRGKGTPRLRMADLAEAMCTSLTSLSIFQFEGADETDLYFSLKGSKDEIMAKLQDSPEPPPFERGEYEIDDSPVALPSFERLMRDGEAIAHECDALRARNEQSKRENADLEAQVALVSDPAELRRQIADAQETLLKMGRF